MPGRLTDESPYPPLRLSVQVRGPEVVVAASGELDLAGVPAVTATLAEAVTARCRRVVIDASALTFLDAAGLRALCAKPAGRDGDLDVVLRAPSPPVRRLLELTNMCGLVERPVAAPASGELIA
jgi:anti-anti-sigma factor